jgi:hypothetical protein
MTDTDLTAVASESARLILDATRLRVLADGEYEAEAEALALELEGPGFSLAACLHALDAARLAVLAALDRDMSRVSPLLLEAAWAADDTFVPGSAEAESFALILAAIGDEAEARAA